MATKVSTPMLQPETQFGLVPPGAVMSFAMSAAPMGWLPCDGAAINRFTYGPLFSAIRTTFGVGDGANTFNVPDLRGEFIRGWDAGRSIDTSRMFGSPQKGTAMTFNVNRGEAVLHHIGAGDNVSQDPNQSGRQAVGADRGNKNVDYPDTTAWAIGTTAGFFNLNDWMNDIGWGGGVTRPRNVALLYCIKF
jgi:microcystin-dependent protein